MYINFKYNILGMSFSGIAKNNRVKRNKKTVQCRVKVLNQNELLPGNVLQGTCTCGSVENIGYQFK